MNIATKKNHFLIKIDSLKDEENSLEKVGSIFLAPDNKNVMVEYKTAEIIKVSQVITEEYKGLYEEGDKIMIHPATKGSKIGEYFYVPVDTIFGKL